jgi:hypothetical protein
MKSDACDCASLLGRESDRSGGCSGEDFNIVVELKITLPFTWEEDGTVIRRTAVKDLAVMVRERRRSVLATTARAVINQLTDK